jgi:hypothetical protein
VLQEREETNRVYTFLTALDSSYEAIRAQILLSIEKLTFDGVTTLIRQEAIRHVAMGAFDSNPKSEAHAFTAKRRGIPRIDAGFCVPISDQRNLKLRQQNENFSRKP